MKSILVVGDPAFGAPFDNLQRLPGAAREGRLIASMYDESTLVEDAEATPARLLELLPEADAVHIGAHSIGSTEFPDECALVLAPEAGRTGALYARDVASLTLHHTRVVVLGTCGVADGPSSNALARAFVAAGVPSVVSALWAINDRQSADFLGEFHRNYRLTGDAAQALRRTQLGYATTPVPGHERSAMIWGAFQVTVGS
jgi:CHAT domain-containing protein